MPPRPADLESPITAENRAIVQKVIDMALNLCYVVAS